MTDRPTPLEFDRRQLAAGLGAAFIATGFSRGAEASPIAGLDEVIPRFAAANAFNGVVLLGSNGVRRYDRAFGFADIESQRAARLDDAFGIASISKWLTTLAVLRLVDRGRLDLDAPIARWLPDYRKDNGARLTLRHLLWNSSGLTEQFSPQSKADPALLTLDIPTDDAVRRFASADLYFDPGAKFDYIFASWILVYAIIEAVTARPFAQSIRALVLDPLGLRHTGLYKDFTGAAAVVPSYASIAPLQRRAYDHPLFLAAAGGYVSTASDLLRAAHLAFDTRFLSLSSQRALVSKRTAVDEYALGGRVKSLMLSGADRIIAWETGNTAGYRSVMAHRLDTRRTVVLLNNTGLAQRVLDNFATAIFSQWD